MAVIQRPGKEGNATTYQGKVAAGYTNILASEVDADIDTIYSAWNGGADTVNIKDGAVTQSKLAAGAVTAGALGPNAVQTANLANGAVTLPKLDPGVQAPINGQFGTTISLNPRGQVLAATTYMDVAANGTGSAGYDSSKPVWWTRADYTADQFSIFRQAAGGGAAGSAFTVRGSDGKTYCTLADKSVTVGEIATGGSTYVRQGQTTFPNANLIATPVLLYDVSPSVDVGRPLLAIGHVRLLVQKLTANAITVNVNVTLAHGGVGVADGTAEIVYTPMYSFPQSGHWVTVYIPVVVPMVLPPSAGPWRIKLFGLQDQPSDYNVQAAGVFDVWQFA